MRILFVADHLKFGGAERHLVSLAAGLVAIGHEVAVAYLKAHDELAGELRQAGVRQVICCESRGGLDLGALRRLTSQVCEFEPDLIVPTLQYSLMYSVLARTLARTRKPLAFICHSMEHVQRSRNDRLRFAVYRHFYRIADQVIFVSHLQRSYFESLGVRIRKDKVIHNGIDLDRFSPQSTSTEALALRHRLGFANDEFVVGICAGFREEKRQVDLLDALARLRARGVRARGLLVGDGVMRSQIESRRTALGLDDAVVLVGFQQDVRPFVEACNVMALTSHAETFPISTLEYMALGKPLVATDVGGVSEQIVDGKNGLMYSVGDIEALTEKLSLLTNQRERERIALAARRTVEAEFSLQSMVKRFDEAFRQSGEEVFK